MDRFVQPERSWYFNVHHIDLDVVFFKMATYFKKRNFHSSSFTSICLLTCGWLFSLALPKRDDNFNAYLNVLGMNHIDLDVFQKYILFLFSDRVAFYRL